MLYLQSKCKGTKIRQTILITGASQGMGKAVSIQLSAKGANVVLVARDVGKLKAALEEVKVCIASPAQSWCNVLIFSRHQR